MLADTVKKQGKTSGELRLIDEIRQVAGRRRYGQLVLGIGDDCAILRPPDKSEVLVTTDFTLEGKHFRRDLHPARSVGHRCLARGLSDLAAMGATPMAAFLSLALPKEMVKTAKGRAWVRDFFAGLRGLGDRFKVPLAGGDTAESPSGLVLTDITLVGSAPVGKALRRSGARPGDILYCTGRLGGSAAELEGMFARGRMARLNDTADGTGHPHLLPEPRLKVGEALVKRALASACMDLSDGLSTDLAHLCAESRVSAEIAEEALPLHALASMLGGQRGLTAALNGGEDYELLFSARPTMKLPRKIGGVEITRIGRVVRRKSGIPDITLLRVDGSREALAPGGWEHFSGLSSRGSRGRQRV